MRIPIMEAMATFMGYNMLQVAACALMAFHTRNLPDNFNESRFITLCVSTLLVIWITFVPSYARADGSDAKTKLLVIAQAINHAMALSFLYMPKIYAILQGGAQFYRNQLRYSHLGDGGVFC
nr:hypothetical protein BaRGS_034771 [Batillaria attramentaria]